MVLKRISSIAVGFILVMVVLSMQCKPAIPPPSVLLSDSNGNIAEEFNVMGDLYGTFQELMPDTRYDINVVDNGGNTISHASYKANEMGVIPSVPLWWDIGAEYSKSRIGHLNLNELFERRYFIFPVTIFTQMAFECVQ